MSGLDPDVADSVYRRGGKHRPIVAKISTSSHRWWWGVNLLPDSNDRNGHHSIPEKKSIHAFPADQKFSRQLN